MQVHEQVSHEKKRDVLDFHATTCLLMHHSMLRLSLMYKMEKTSSKDIHTNGPPWEVMKKIEQLNNCFFELIRLLRSDWRRN